jgi:DNA-binding NtrC family response regulator
MKNVQKRIKLLIVDDDAKLLATMSERLQLKDFDVQTASEGKEAIKAAKRGKFDVAILDLRMPGMEGMEVLSLLKSKHKFLEIIILTGFASIESAVEAGKLGAFGYLEKPYNFESLVEKIREAYATRLKKKFKHDEKRMERLKLLSMGDPLHALSSLTQIDDDEM